MVLVLVGFKLCQTFWNILLIRLLGKLKILYKSQG